MHYNSVNNCICSAELIWIIRGGVEVLILKMFYGFITLKLSVVRMCFFMIYPWYFL